MELNRVVAAKLSLVINRGRICCTRIGRFGTCSVAARGDCSPLVAPRLFFMQLLSSIVTHFFSICQLQKANFVFVYRKFFVKKIGLIQSVFTGSFT